MKIFYICLYYLDWAHSIFLRSELHGGFHLTPPQRKWPTEKIRFHFGMWTFGKVT